MKALLIIPEYYGYEKKIIQVFKELGYDVNVIIENLPTVSYYYRVINVYFSNYSQYCFDRYYRNKIKDKSYDVVLVVRGQTISSTIIKSLRIDNPSALFVLYEWDSVKNNPNALNIHKLFDRVFTFDFKDAEKYGWVYRPLFFCKRAERNERRKFDLTFIGKIHSKRLKILRKIKNEYNNYNCYIHLYEKRLIYLKQKYFNKSEEFTGVSDNDIKHYSISLDDTFDIYSKSNILVDYTHPKQTGLTMRTIESIGCKCKLITNNKEIINSNFYNPNNVYIYEEESFSIPKSFFEDAYVDLSDEIYDYYSINGWIKELIDFEKD